MRAGPIRRQLHPNGYGELANWEGALLGREENLHRARYSSTDSNFASAPKITRPKGSRAISGIGEEFAANSVTGTGSMSVPVFTSPARSGFGPQHSLSYDSGAGNGPFGFGWSLTLPSITPRTDKGLPKYFDAEEFDIFVLSSAEDLVPILVDTGGWQRQPFDSPANESGYIVQRYRPRIEELFARIERWTDKVTGISHLAVHLEGQYHDPLWQSRRRQDRGTD
jgi:hypothetical protein